MSGGKGDDRLEGNQGGMSNRPKGPRHEISSLSLSSSYSPFLFFSYINV